MAIWRKLPKEVFEIVPELYSPAHAVLVKNELSPPQFLCLSLLKRFGVKLGHTDISTAPADHRRRAARLSDATAVLMELAAYSSKAGPTEVFKSLEDRRLIVRTNCNAKDFNRLFSNDDYLLAVESFLGRGHPTDTTVPRTLRQSHKVVILEHSGLELLRAVDRDVSDFVNAVISTPFALAFKGVFTFLSGSSEDLIRSIRRESKRLRSSNSERVKRDGDAVTPAAQRNDDGANGED